MNLDRFLEILSALNLDWGLHPDGAIRSCLDCPITATAAQLTGRVFSVEDWPEAAASIGFGAQVAASVQEAADNYRDCDGEVRNRLMEACGL
jgi:hypothetical protein